jgi:hypothetical protein
MRTSQKLKDSTGVIKSQLKLNEDEIPEYLVNVIEKLPLHSKALFCTIHIVLRYMKHSNRYILRKAYQKYVGYMGL